MHGSVIYAVLLYMCCSLTESHIRCSLTQICAVLSHTYVLFSHICAALSHIYNGFSHTVITVSCVSMCHKTIYNTLLLHVQVASLYIFGHLYNMHFLASSTEFCRIVGVTTSPVLLGSLGCSCSLTFLHHLRCRNESNSDASAVADLPELQYPSSDASTRRDHPFDICQAHLAPKIPSVSEHK